MIAITVGEAQILETSAEDADLMGWRPIHAIGYSVHSRDAHSLMEAIRETAMDLRHQLAQEEEIAGFRLPQRGDTVIFYICKVQRN